MKSDEVNKRRTQFFWNKFKFFGFKKAFRISLNILGVNFFSVDLILRKKKQTQKQSHELIFSRDQVFT